MSRSDVRVAPGRRLVATAGAAILGAGLLALAGTARQSSTFTVVDWLTCTMLPSRPPNKRPPRKFNKTKSKAQL